MELINNSTIDTVIDFANVKFGMELTKDQVSAQLRNLSFSETLKLINSIKADDNDAFSSIIDLSAVSEGWSELPSINREKYQERDGLEGPFPTKSGKVVYYDPKEGKYYDPDTDIYLSYDEWKSLDEAYGTQSTAQPSRATIRSQGSGVEQRRYNNTAQDQARDATAIPRTVAGGNKQPTGQGASRVGSADPDDIHRSEIEGQANANAQAGAQRDAEIERLKQLAMGK